MQIYYYICHHFTKKAFSNQINYARDCREVSQTNDSYKLTQGFRESQKALFCARPKIVCGKHSADRHFFLLSSPWLVDSSVRTSPAFSNICSRVGSSGLLHLLTQARTSLYLWLRKSSVLRDWLNHPVMREGIGHLQRLWR
jgi:hypothetical protein